MSSAHRREISDLFGESPTLIEAADFGWVQRSRLYWGLAAHLRPGLQTGKDWEYFPPGTHFDDLGVIRWMGQRLPGKWQPDAGCSRSAITNQVCQSPPVPGGSWRATYDGRRYSILTTCFPHKPDHGKRNADDRQLKRFQGIKGGFPCMHTQQSNASRWARRTAASSEFCPQVSAKD